MQDNIFELLKTYSKDQLRDLMSSRGIIFKEYKYHCPFHGEDKTPSGSITFKNGSAFFHCFACGTAGDAGKFIELYEKLSPAKAAKVALNFIGFDFDESLNEEELEAKKEAFIKLQKEQEAARAKLEQEAEQKAQLVRAKLNKVAPNFLQNAKDLTALAEPFDIFIAKTDYFNYLFDRYIGFDHQNDSVVIVIPNEQGETLNIKHRTKFKWDDEARCYSNERLSGKWIGASGASAYPFPIDFYHEFNSDIVIICEGEKDAINLCSLGVCALTLGGVNNSWQKHKDLLKDKIVYIWFDNDKAGYTNAIARYKEIESVAKSIYITLFYKLCPAAPAKYDISDYLADNQAKFTNSDRILDKLIYSSFKLTNDLIDEISELYDSDLKEFKEPFIKVTFNDICKEIMQTDKDGNYLNIIPVKGELDDKLIDHFVNMFKSKDLKEITAEVKSAMLENRLFVSPQVDKDLDQWAKVVDKICDFQKILRTNYHQVHLADMCESFVKTIRKLGYDIAEYKGQIYFWNGNFYSFVDDREIYKFLLHHWMSASGVDKKKITDRTATELIDNIRGQGVLIDAKRKEPHLMNKRVINLRNGSVIISKNGKITFTQSHNKKLYATNMLDFEYNAEAKCPKWERFLSQVMNDEDRLTLMEFIGYCFLPSHDYEAFLFLYGKSGSNGKSVILDVLRSFFGEDNVSNLQLQQLEGHELHGLANKMLNIGSEIDKLGVDKGQFSNLKALVSPRDQIQINPKNQQPYSLKPEDKPKFAFAGNDKPKSNIDNAVFRRMLLIGFDKEIKDDEKIRGLSERFSDELDGIFALALEGLRRLVTNGKFTKGQKMQDALNEYKDEVNPTRVFIRDAITPNKAKFTPNKYLYLLYCEFAKERGNKPMSQTKFTQVLKDELTMSNIEFQVLLKKSSIPRIGLASVERGFAGIEINTDFDITSVTINNMNLDIENMSESCSFLDGDEL